VELSIPNRRTQFRCYQEALRGLFDTKTWALLEYGSLKQSSFRSWPCKHKGFSHESGQDYRHYNYRDSKHPLLRSLLPVTERLMFLPVVAIHFRFLPSTLRLLLSCLAMLLAVGSSPKTAIIAQEPNADEVIRVSTDLTLFPIRVRTHDGVTPIQLTADDFQLKDPDQITTSSYFSVGADRVALVFALDESGSLREILAQQRDAALNLFERFGKNSRVAVLRFSERPVIVVPLGNDSSAARSAFDFGVRHDSRTALFDGAYAALKMFADAPHDPAERRIIILISDGLDNISTIQPSAIITAAQNSNVSFYTIQIPLFTPVNGHLAVRGPSKGFKELAEKTGGKYFLTATAKSALQPMQNQDLSSVFRAIEEDLRSQYVVGFYVSEKARDDRSHKVSISITKHNVEYSVAQNGFSRTHNFSIKLSARKAQ
jgi:Ca-activated chloride channel family protein